MDRKRFSFSRPQAESTMNGNISCNSPSFQWGQKNLNISMINKSGAKSPVRERNGLANIDARTYADVKSKGLASRIVKYHECGVRLNRSVSMNNLSGKSSSSGSNQFAASSSSKPELPYKAMKQNVSMTHIAPPDKSSFYGNTLSGLLRSTSVITLQQNGDDLSSENRPIIHPPVTEKELQPTRSALDVLKEISRKRIINEGTVDESDTSKKYCSRIEPDFNGTVYADFRNSFIPPPNTYKRQRESSTAVAAENYHLNQIEQNSFHLMQQCRMEPSSPEQNAKRRHCNYNNDITSSLSSSRKSSNKRKLFENEGIQRQEKQFRYQPDIRLSELSTALSYNSKTPITPLPNTPQNEIRISPQKISIAAVPVHKSLSAPTITETTSAAAATSSSTNKSSSSSSIRTEKPKLTLFNKNYETGPNVTTLTKEISENSAADDNENYDNEGDAYAGIQFVKPKKSASGIGGGSAGNLLIERTQKSKLALMLSGLRGELYLGEPELEEPINPKSSSKQDEIKQQNSQQISTAIASKIDNKISNEKSSTTTAVNIQQPQKSILLPTVVPIVANTAVTDGVSTVPANTIKTPTSPSTKISSPLTGIKLKPQSPTITIASTSNSMPTPTFSFGTTTTTATVPSLVSATNSSTATSPPAFTFGAPKANTTSVATVNQPISTTNLISFAGKSTAPDPTSATGLPTFSFGVTASSATTTLAKLQPTTTTLASSSIISTTTNAPQPTPAAASTPFSFGNPTANLQQSSSKESAPPFSFGSGKPAGGFSFGSPSTNPSAKVESSQPIALPTAVASTATTTSTSGGGFSFASTSTAPTTPGGFSFKNATTGATNTSVFGGGGIAPIKFGALTEQQTKVQTPTAPSNTSIFGVKPIEQQQQQQPILSVAPNAFGVPKNEKNLFGFGGNTGANNNNSTPIEPQKSTTNLFNMPTAKQNSTFNFGGSTLNNQTTNAFTQPVNTQSKTFAFGNATLNTTASAITTTDIPKPTTTTFSFSNAKTQQSIPFSFSSNTTNSAPVANGNANKPFNFGGGGGIGANTNSTITTENKTAFSFGGAGGSGVGGATEISKAPSTFSFSGSIPGNNSLSFGSAANKSIANETPKPTNAFGNTTSNSTQNPAFVFGGGNGMPSAQQTTTFGGTTNNTTSNNNIFNFSGGSTKTTTSLGINAIQTKPVESFTGFSNSTTPNNGFSFNKSNNNNNNTTSQSNTPSAIVKPTTTFGSPSNTFLFQGGNSAPTAATTGNLFASPTTPANSTPFGAVTNGNTPSTATIAPNMFAVPTSSERPMRKATRRLTKN